MSDRTAADADAPAPLEDLSGRVLGDFELVRRLGVGGMGQVYLARQKSLKRQVAIKILRAELAANTTALRRFQAEAEAVANITHANIVQVYAIGADAGLHYMALEYVDGRTLRDLLEKKGIPDLPLAITIIRQVAAALERAGELGFVHRDIKPENILLSKKGEVKVTDFGLSRAFAADVPIHLTQSGVTMGTPLYMSPEQVRGQPVDPRSDIYSFGVTCYHMLAGEPPFRASTAFDVALMHVQADPRPLGSLRPDLPPELCAIVHRMMAKKPEARYQSAREVLNDLARYLSGTGPTAPVSASVIFPATGNSSTHVPAMTSGQYATQPMGTPAAPWRYAVVGLLTVAAVAGGAALHWATSPPPMNVQPQDALADLDPDPDYLRERDLRRQLGDKNTKHEVAFERILELADLVIRGRRFDDAMRLFDGDLARRFPAFEPVGKDPPLHRQHLNVAIRLGRGIVFAHRDKAGESNEEFLATLTLPVLPKDKKKGLILTPADEFFFRTPAGPEWKRAVGEALDRNAKNLGGPMPPELHRLRLPPVRGPRG
jgi:eukaryotic-like serine/threonine-protein kinase